MSEWVEGTLPTWAKIVEPVAAKVSAASGEALPEEMRAMAGPMLGMLAAAGRRHVRRPGRPGPRPARAEVVVRHRHRPAARARPASAALLPANIAAFGAGLASREDEVRLYLALREAAHQRLFAPRAVAARHGCSARSRSTPAASTSTPAGSRSRAAARPERPRGAPAGPASRASSSREDTPAQKAALARLETLLALVEGWVDAVVTRASDGRIPGAGALRETVRRRRATGGPAEQTFATLVGLELRPRRLREAAALWELLARAPRRRRPRRRLGPPGPAADAPTTSTTRTASPSGGSGEAGWDMSALDPPDDK